MTQFEMLMAERAADALLDLILSLQSRDPQHPEIAALNKLYGEILYSAVRCIPQVQVEEVRHGA